MSFANLAQLMDLYPAPRGVLQVGHHISDRELEALREAWEASFVGTGRVVVMPEGVEWTPFNTAPPPPPPETDTGYTYGGPRYRWRWREVRDTAALWAAPWWALTWCLTLGKFGAPLWTRDKI